MKIIPTDYTLIASDKIGSIYVDGLWPIRLVQSSSKPNVGDEIPTLDLVIHGESRVYRLPTGISIYGISIGSDSEISNNPGE